MSLTYKNNWREKSMQCLERYCKIWSLVLATGVMLASCEAVHESFKEDHLYARPQPPANWTGEVSVQAHEPIAWIDALQDTHLMALVEDAQRSNYDIAAISARVAQSRALVKRARADLQPSADLAVRGEQRDDERFNRETFDRNSAGADVSWEIDLWGRLQSGKKAAELNAAAEASDLLFSQQALAASVARAYFLLIETKYQTDIANRSLGVLSDIHRLVRLQYDNDLATSQDLALAESDLLTAQENLLRVKRASRSAERSLEVLLGRYPSLTLDTGSGFPDLPSLPAAGFPSELLERRPDIIASQQRILASRAGISQAKRARLPRLILDAQVGTSAKRLQNLFGSGNLAWALGSALTAPLIDGGRRGAEIKSRMATERGSVAAYGQLVLDAFLEVEEGLDEIDILAQRETLLAQVTAKTESALAVGQTLYLAGETDLIDVLSIQQRVLDAQSDLAQLQRRRLDAWVNLNLALGGHWK